MTGLSISRPLPPVLEPLRDFAADLRWTWSHAADHLWRALDPVAWSIEENPWHLLQDVPQENLEQLAGDPEAVREIRRLARARREYLDMRGWFASKWSASGPRGVAFFSMEFGLGEALPLYAGGLGVLAGDYLKAASDLGVPAVGVGLLYQEGYFRQTIDSNGRQHELYPYNDPTTLPISPVLASDGRRLQVELEFPGRALQLRVWQADVGRARLYLLDSNDPANSPADRGITAKLYGGDRDVQFLQEVVLGIAGWRLIDTLGLDVEICHLNEGHAALAVLERARCFMARVGARVVPFREALWATRAGNVFTTHTAVQAAFDRFGRQWVEQHLPYLRIYADHLGVPLSDIMALGRRDPGDPDEPFNLAYLAMRGCTGVNAVSALHGDVSRRLFQDLYPRWPKGEIPIIHVTNGVHTPTWDSAAADRVWEAHCGKERWLGDLGDSARAIANVSDAELWALRAEGREALVVAARHRLTRQLASRGVAPDALAHAAGVLDPKALTLGFARRFTAYKRLDLLLRDQTRLIRLLTNRERPVQLLVAGKAHPAEDDAKRVIQEWVQLAQDARIRDRLVFLEDYDITLAQELVRGVDVWINTPRRPWEACGTSGMKVLVNGGLSVSELDGWWAEAYSPDVGWAIGDGTAHEDTGWDDVEADQLYRVLEDEVIPEFYGRDAGGLPTRWLARIRTSMSTLAPRFSANRMVREYVDVMYVPATERLRARTRDDRCLARELAEWADSINHAWSGVTFGALDVRAEPDGYHFSVSVDLGSLEPCVVHLELYADPMATEPATRVPMTPVDSNVGARAVVYEASIATTRPSSHFTPRVVPFHSGACIPAEAPQIRWQR
jgi:starch phosphorylase